jgi:peptide deformylase
MTKTSQDYYEIITFENASLYERLPLYVGDYKEIKDTSDKMIVTMTNKNGIGLAATQVNIPIRMFVMGDYHSGFWTIVNPEILNASEEIEIMEEGCLSFPQQRYIVARPKIIEVSYNDINGKLVESRFKNIWARCFLHETDHLNGITFDNRGEKN